MFKRFYGGTEVNFQGYTSSLVSGHLKWSEMKMEEYLNKLLNRCINKKILMNWENVLNRKETIAVVLQCEKNVYNKDTISFDLLVVKLLKYWMLNQSKFS